MSRSEDSEKRRQWGEVIWESPGPLPAGSFQTVTLRYVAGSLGVDERGGIRISMRGISDFGAPQFSDPAGDNYVSAESRSDLRLQLHYDIKGNVRPFGKTIYIHILDGSLNQGDEIRVVLGDRRQGSRGWRLQTFVEEEFVFRVEVDPFGAHDYVPAALQPALEIAPGAGFRYQLHVPSLAGPGEEFLLRVKCEDGWGNPLRELAERPEVFRLRAGAGAKPEAVRPERVRVEPTHDRGVLSYRIEGIAEPGIVRFFIADGAILGGTSNPLVVAAGPLGKLRPYWCDLHGQTGETIGTGTVEGYFDFGRHYGFLDGSCHQGNDFQIDGPTWERIVAAANDSYEEGAFVTIQGIEWSGTTPMGGDHNVLFNEPHPPLYRSTGWLASDGSKMEEVAPLRKLYQVLKKHDAMTIPHIGGRPAAFLETDPELERLVELHSAWGTFEWVYQRAFAKGFKVGFVCNSDGHKQRPGASYPGASTFGTLGGLTCLLAEGKTRQAFWDALKARRCYGTTGQRIYVTVSSEGHEMGADMEVAGEFAIAGSVTGTAPIWSVDLLRDGEVIDRRLPEAWAEATPEEQWVVIRLGGSRVYGRERKVTWQGELSLADNSLEEAKMHGGFNPLQGIKEQDGKGLRFDFISTGNSLNLCLKVGKPGRGTLAWKSSVCEFSLPLAELGPTPKKMFSARIDQFVEVSACPIERLPLELDFDFRAPAPEKPATPYFVRVLQLDEAKAWTSPFYVSAKK